MPAHSWDCQLLDTNHQNNMNIFSNWFDPFISRKWLDHVATLFKTFFKHLQLNRMHPLTPGWKKPHVHPGFAGWLLISDLLSSRFGLLLWACWCSLALCRSNPGSFDFDSGVPIYKKKGVNPNVSRRLQPNNFDQF